MKRLPRRDLDEIVKRTKHMFGDDCTVDIKFVDEIQPCASGKYRYTISEIPQRYPIAR